MSNLIDPENGSRELREPLFDVMTYAPLAVLPTVISFFGHTEDVSGPEVTNMTKPNELPAGEHMKVMRLRVGFANTDAGDLAAILKAYRAQLIVAGKAVLTAPLYMVPYGGTLDTAYILFEISEQDAIEIQEGARFRVELQSKAGYTLVGVGKGTDINVALDGIHAVPIN